MISSLFWLRGFGIQGVVLRKLVVEEWYISIGYPWLVGDTKSMLELLVVISEEVLVEHIEGHRAMQMPTYLIHKYSSKVMRKSSRIISHPVKNLSDPLELPGAKLVDSTPCRPSGFEVAYSTDTVTPGVSKPNSPLKPAEAIHMP